MAMDQVNSAPGADSFQDLYDKYNALITALKAGTVGQLLTGISAGTEPTWQLPSLQFVEIEIGDWNMDSTDVVQISLPEGFDPTKIRSIAVMIRPDVGAFPDADNFPVPLNCGHFDAGGDCFAGVTDYDPQGGIDYATASCGVLALYRKASGLFDSSNFNATSYNRGYITIGYVS